MKTLVKYEFLKILRNTRDGAQGVPITEENSKLIETAYQTLCFEGYLVKKGGNKKGFLKSEKSLTDEALKSLREAYARLYSNNGDNMMVLNKGIEFQETSNTSAEMQLNENKLTNAQEFAKVFHISTDVMAGKGAENGILIKSGEALERGGVLDLDPGVVLRRRPFAVDVVFFKIP